MTSVRKLQVRIDLWGKPIVELEKLGREVKWVHVGQGK